MLSPTRTRTNIQGSTKRCLIVIVVLPSSLFTNTMIFLATILVVTNFEAILAQKATHESNQSVVAGYFVRL